VGDSLVSHGKRPDKADDRSDGDENEHANAYGPLLETPTDLLLNGRSPTPFPSARLPIIAKLFYARYGVVTLGRIGIEVVAYLIRNCDRDDNCRDNHDSCQDGFHVTRLRQAWDLRAQRRVMA
jgi:hypothetical protein